MRPSQIRNLILLALLLALILLALTSTVANFIVEYNWWKEVGQVETWISMMWYSIGASVAGALVAFIALWVAHAQGLHFAGVRRRDFRVYSRLVPLGLVVVALLFASASIDYWTIMRFFGARGARCPLPLGRTGFFARPAVLPVRPPFLFGSTRVCVCAGDFLRPSLLGHGAGMAVMAAWRVTENFLSGATWGAAAGRRPYRLRPRNRRNSAAWFCYLGFSRQLRASVQLPRLHDRRRLRGRKGCPSRALAPHYCGFSGAPASLDVEIQEGDSPHNRLFYPETGLARHRSRRLCATE